MTMGYIECDDVHKLEHYHIANLSPHGQLIIVHTFTVHTDRDCICKQPIIVRHEDMQKIYTNGAEHIKVVWQMHGERKNQPFKPFKIRVDCGYFNVNPGEIIRHGGLQIMIA